MKERIFIIKDKFLDIYQLFKKTLLCTIDCLNKSKKDIEQITLLMKNQVLSFYIEIWSFYNEIITEYFCNAIDESRFPQENTNRADIKIKNFFIDIVFNKKNDFDFGEKESIWDNYEKAYKSIIPSSNHKFVNIYKPITKKELAKHFDNVNRYRNDYAHAKKYKNNNKDWDILNSSVETMINSLLSDIYLLNLIFNRLFDLK